MESDGYVAFDDFEVIIDDIECDPRPPAADPTECKDDEFKCAELEEESNIKCISMVSKTESNSKDKHEYE